MANKGRAVARMQRMGGFSMEERGWRHATNLKRKALEQWYGFECQKCHKTSDDSDDLVCHHRHYRNFGVEEKEDVVILCRACHADLHDRLHERELGLDDIPFVDPTWEKHIRDSVRRKLEDPNFWPPGTGKVLKENAYRPSWQREVEDQT